MWSESNCIKQRPSSLHRGLANDLFPSGFPSKIVYAYLISSVPATCGPHLILFDLTILMIFT
jgi:hypothetical protein